MLEITYTYLKQVFKMSILKNLIFILFLFFSSLLALSACGSSLHSLSSFRVPELRFDAKNLSNSEIDSTIFLNNFLDSRIDSSLVSIEEQRLLKEGDVSIEVTRELSEALKDMGFKISDSAPVVVAGEVVEWMVQVNTKIQDTASAKASLHIEVLDPSNKRAYSGVYNGFAAKKSLSLQKVDIRKLLRTSMQEAMKQMLEDKQLIKVMTSF